MAMVDRLAATGLLVSTAIALIAGGLGLLQWVERARRAIDLSDDDRIYFFWQDLRRGLGVVLMLIAALGVGIGSRLEPFVTDSQYPAQVVPSLRFLAGSWIEPFLGLQANLPFLAVWFAVIVLVLVLLALALLDWKATRRYARRHRQSMARERSELLRETFWQGDARHNGSTFEPQSDEF
jgi:hypothetical protein